MVTRDPDFDAGFNDPPPEGIDPRSPDYALRHPPVDETGGGGGGGGGGSGSSTTPANDADAEATDDGLTDYTDAEQTRFNGVPGLPEVWQNEETKEYYLVYYPESGPQPPVPLLFTISTEEELKSLFGDKDPVADKTLSEADMEAAGSVIFGEMASIDRYNAANELIEDPWAGFTSRMERAMESMPWLAEDPEVFAIVAGAYLEGRELESWELEQTEYFQSHSKGQRDAMRLQLSDPEGYSDRHDSYASRLFDEIASFGIDPNSNLVSWVADQYNSGDWTLDQALDQIQAYAGFGGAAELDSEFAEFIENEGLGTNEGISNFDAVRDLYKEWLGPSYPPDEDVIRKWASAMHNDTAGGRDALVEHLRGQRRVLFPNYEDENATYAQIAAPWRSYTQNIWGVPIDETDPAFQNIVQMNDPLAAQSAAREVGSDRGYARVVSTMANDIEQTMRTGVRGAV